MLDFAPFSAFLYRRKRRAQKRCISENAFRMKY